MKLSKHGMYNTASELQIIKALSVDCKMSKAHVVKSCMWILPNVNEIKLCCDGSALGNPGPSGIGIVYRDWEGRVLGTFCKLVGTTTNYLAKVNAIINGVEKAIYRGWNNLQSGLAQPGEKQTFRHISWLKEDPEKTYLLRNGLREDRRPMPKENEGGSSSLQLRSGDSKDIKKETELLKENPLRNFPLNSLPR
ncbi:hypothetical protein GIB67_023633 [Kingdonia uniflora]|uniref:RNase H type-1 domain-containing protein n=1 Tax=Kingdonia uniflora TaxID=39325 RepID=A0A7J7L555_9MAGN|nr:hypothetical protein GIB67_023633 [Kingdonia uniflora]